jgi:hypothetical protein
MRGPEQALGRQKRTLRRVPYPVELEAATTGVGSGRGRSRRAAKASTDVPLGESIFSMFAPESAKGAFRL